MWNLLVFAVIGLLAGTAARMLYPGRQPMQILGTLTLGVVGALVGGMLSWIYWPAVDDQFQSGNLLLSILGAVTTIVLWAGVAYAEASVVPGAEPHDASRHSGNVEKNQVMLDLRQLEHDILAHGKVYGHELEVLRRQLYADGKIERREADFLVELHKRVQHL